MVNVRHKRCAVAVVPDSAHAQLQASAATVEMLICCKQSRHHTFMQTLQAF